MGPVTWQYTEIAATQKEAQKARAEQLEKLKFELTELDRRDSAAVHELYVFIHDALRHRI